MKNIKKILGFLILCLIISLIPTKVDAAVSINVKSKTINIGDTFDLKINGTTKKVTWSSSDKKIATVSSSGKVKGVGKGTTTITGKVNGKSYSCKVGVRYKTTIKKQVILNKNKIKITTMSLNEDEIGYTIKFMIENSNDKDFNVGIDSLAVNGLMYGDGYYSTSESVPSNKKAMLKYTFKKSWFKENNMSYIKYVNIMFYVSYVNRYEEKNYSLDFDTDKITIKTNLFDKVGKYKIKGKKVYSSEYADLYFSEKDNNFVYLTAVNKTSNSFIDIDNISINDWSYDLYKNTGYSGRMRVRKNEAVVYKIELNSDFLEEYEIDKIESIEFNLSFGLLHITTDKIKLNF